MTLPKHCGMPALTCNIEGLRAHAVLNNVFGSVDVDVSVRKWRSWLVHCLVKSSRHYNEARNIIYLQLAEADVSNGGVQNGRVLHIIDFPLAIEDCITSIVKLNVCLKALEQKVELLAGFSNTLKNEKLLIGKLRDKLEHMHNQIACGQTGNGPIFLVLNESGNSIKLLALEISFLSLHAVLEHMYAAVAGLFSDFNAASPVEPSGALVLSMSVQITQT